MKCELAREMLNRHQSLILTFILFLFQIGTAAEQAPSQTTQDLMGSWHNASIYCSLQDPGTRQLYTKKTRLFPIESLDFEPDVTLTIFSDGRQTYLRKSAGNRSCKANDVQERNFLDVTYAVKFVPTVVYGSTVYTMTSSKVISPEVNEKAFEQCGSKLNGLILKTLIRLKYPEYFQREMGRLYHLTISEGQLALRFQDPDICGGGLTVMIFDRNAD